MGDIYKLGLGSRVMNGLRRAGIETIAELSSCTDDQLMSLRHIGVTSLAEIRGKLREYDEEFEILPEKNVVPTVRCAEDYANGAYAMRREILRMLDEMTVSSTGQRWLVLREVTRMIRRLETP